MSAVGDRLAAWSNRRGLHRLSWLIHCAIIVLTTNVVFLSTLGNSFHLDDYYRVVDNPGIHTVMPIWRHFVDPGTMATLDRIVQYRPLLPLTLSLNYAIAGDSLPGYHIGNLLFQIIASLLVYFLVNELLGHWSLGSPAWRVSTTRQSAVALIVALLFAIHPVSGILVNYISGRDLLLMQVFLSASVLAYLRIRRQPASIGRWSFHWVLRWALMLVLLELSMLAKTNPVVMPLLIVAVEVTVGQERLRHWAPWIRALPFAAVVIMHFAFTRFVLHFSDLANVVDTASGAAWRYALTQARLHLFHYMRNIIWPFPIRQEPLIIPANSLADAAVLAGAAFIIATIAIGWRLRRSAPVLSFCILAYWILMIPESSVIPFYALAVDYRPYPSSPFLFLAIVLLLDRLLRPQVSTLILSLFVVYCAIVSFTQNGTWRTEETLWSHSIQYGGDAVAHLNLAMSLADRRDPRVQSNLEEALRLNPNYITAHIDLGLLLIDVGKTNQGLTQLRTAVQLSPHTAQSYYWLARAYIDLGRIVEAARTAAQAAKLDQHNLDYQYQAALDAQQVTNYAGSLSFLSAIERIDPSYKDTLFLKGWALWKLNKRTAAVVAYRAFLRWYPRHVQAQFNLGYTLMMLGQYSAAITPFKLALALDPHYTEVHLHLATCYQKLGRFAEAARERALYIRKDGGLTDSV